MRGDSGENHLMKWYNPISSGPDTVGTEGHFFIDR